MREKIWKEGKELEDIERIMEEDILLDFKIWGELNLNGEGEGCRCDS